VESSELNIHLLADRPDWVPLLASWFYEEWGQNWPELTLLDYQDQFTSRLNRDRFPLAVVASLDGVPVATTSLKLHEMDIYPQYPHWLGGVYTLPEYRRRGFGAQTIEAAVQQAVRLGATELYLYTRHSMALYDRLGWVTIERPVYRGREVILMKRILLK